MRFSKNQLHQPPSAASLIESLRNIGYTIESAVADLVDNSITAGADKVIISFARRDDGPFRLLILDNGKGMNRQNLVRAMKPGSNSPLDVRNPEDLGRFGLGLKTASFSQCRCLSLASHTKRGKINALRWDLDYVQKKNKWELLEGVDQSMEEELQLLETFASGTLVIWSKADRIKEEKVNTILQAIREHLSVVFHRFLETGELEIHTSMDPNHQTTLPVLPWDPYMRSNFATKVVGKDAIDRHCELVGYVLPHREMCSPEEWRLGGLSEGWLPLQGCYLYRNKRLLMWGGWMRLVRNWRREADTQLARVQIDFDNTWDQEWKINVMKSRATPPRAIRERLKELSAAVREESRQVFIHRGRRSSGKRQGRKDSNTIPVWEQVMVESGGIQFQINQNHPLLLRLAEEKKWSTLFRMIQENLPVVAVWQEQNRIVGSEGRGNLPPQNLDAMAKELREYVRYEMTSGGKELEDVFREVGCIEPFSEHPDIVRKIKIEFEKLLS